MERPRQEHRAFALRMLLVGKQAHGNEHVCAKLGVILFLGREEVPKEIRCVAPPEDLGVGVPANEAGVSEQLARPI
jgi:hypothetical protein